MHQRTSGPPTTVRLFPGITACFLLAFGSGAAAQATDECSAILQTADVSTVSADAFRAVVLTDSTNTTHFVMRRSGTRSALATCGMPRSLRDLVLPLDMSRPAPALSLLPAEMLLVGNSAYPRDWNDGVLWGGRGLNAALTTGLVLRLGPFTAAAAPILAWQGNQQFDTQRFTGSARSEFAHPWWGGNIDAPHRFGDGGFTVVDPGASFARLDAFGLALGVSTENIIWGPAQRNPLLLGATGPGFPHVFFETSRPRNIFIADAELQLFWGLLEESDYFDEDPDNDQRVMAGLLLALHPRLLEGLTLGLGRIQTLTWWPELTLSDAFLGPYRGVTENPSGRAGDNQLLTAFFRWASAGAGLEVYGEWARDDHWGPWAGLLRNLDGSQAWTVGLSKLIRRNSDAWRITAEVTHLSDALPILLHTRGVVVFYTNSSVTQGHTHRGQLLGAPVGPGGQAQYLGVDRIGGAGMTTLSIERARYDDDAYDVFFGPVHGSGARDTELSLRARHLWTSGSLGVSGEAGWSLRRNRDFLGLDTVDAGEAYRRDDNFSMRLGLRWTPEWAR